MVEREILCDNCRKHAPISEMRYDITGKRLICARCRGQKEEELKPRNPKVERLVKSPFGEAKILKFQCVKCHYVFRRSTTHPVTKCPNCGGEKLLKYEKVSADDVLKMSEDKRFSGL